MVEAVVTDSACQAENSYKLTIGLCLYRSDHLAKRSFFSAYLNASEHKDIELVVCDNNPSSDREYIKCLCSDSISYFPNRVNVGATGNAIHVASRARGDFILYLGDDDFLDPFFSECYSSLISNGIFEKYDIISPQPVEFEAPGAIVRHRLPSEYIQGLAALNSLERAQESRKWTRHNYLLWSMYNKKTVRSDVASFYYVYCPTYTVPLDWAQTYGNILCHRICQLNYGFYVYNKKNWAASECHMWRKREALAFSKFLTNASASSLSASDINVLMAINDAAIVCSYLLTLARVYSSQSLSFSTSEYFIAMRDIVMNVYLGRIPGFRSGLQTTIEASFCGMHKLLDNLLETLCQYHINADILKEFLLSTPLVYERLADHVLLSDYVQRHGDYHHVPLSQQHL